MVTENMLLFLSKDSLLEHIEYAKSIRLQISIIEKSYPGIYEKSFREIMNSKIPKECKLELKNKYVEYLSHELYFKSFAKNDKPCPNIKEYFSSENGFCYEMLEFAKKKKCGFVYVVKDRKSGVKILHSSDINTPFLNYTPLLALDLDEHSYFADYGFKREDYLRAAISHLDLSLLFVDEKG